MNNPDHISESLKTSFWVKILKFFDADPGSVMEKNSDPGSGMEKIRIQDPGWKKFGSGINVPDPQNWFQVWQPDASTIPVVEEREAVLQDKILWVRRLVLVICHHHGILLYHDVVHGI
jgi:hypothetical protein